MDRFRTMFIYIMIIFFCGCKTTRKSVYQEKVKDSTVRNIILESKNILEVSTICDSLGNAKEFFQEIETGTGTTKVTLKDNKLKVESKNDSIVYVDRWREKIIDNSKLVTKYVIPFWCWLYMGFVTILVLISFKVIRLN